MKEKPILFSTPMVQAILEDRKTMTRRTQGLEKVNECPDSWKFKEFTVLPFEGNKLRAIFDNISIQEHWSLPVRYKDGDVLWVRESYFDASKYKSAPLFMNGPDLIYKADEEAFIGEHNWIPAMFMPKTACRIWLECTNVRCERLQSISERDAIAEGILPLNMSAQQLIVQGQKYFDYTKPKQLFDYGIDPFWSFNSLWCSINGGESWDANPWVFVYEFKRIEKP